MLKIHYILFIITQNAIWLTLIELVSDCCLTPTQQFFIYIMDRTS